MSDFLETFRAMGVSSWIAFNKRPEGLAISVFDLATPETPLFVFFLNETAVNNLRDLSSEAKSLVVPGVNIKELVDLYNGKQPEWAGQL